VDVGARLVLHEQLRGHLLAGITVDEQERGIEVDRLVLGIGGVRRGGQDEAGGREREPER
jgi:hypothetical protein